MYIALIIFAQFLISLTDLWKKIVFKDTPFSIALVTNWQFLAAIILPFFPMLLYWYVLSKYDLSKSAVTLGVSAVIFSSLLAVLFLHEKASMMNLVGYGFAVLAIVMINWK